MGFPFPNLFKFGCAVRLNPVLPQFINKFDKFYDFLFSILPGRKYRSENVSVLKGQNLHPREPVLFPVRVDLY